MNDNKDESKPVVTWTEPGGEVDPGETRCRLDAAFFAQFLKAPRQE